MAKNVKLKNQIRAELFRCALAGQFVTYAEFFDRIRPGTKMGRFPYQTHFDEIAGEERSHNYPDITFLVRAADGYPRQVDFSSFDLNNKKQLSSLRQGTDALIAMYCPTAKNPY